MKKYIRFALLVSVAIASYIFEGGGDSQVTTAWVQFIPMAISAIGAISGVAQRNKANSLESRNKLPRATVDPNILKNQAIATSAMREGLPAQVYNNQMNQMQQSFATGLRTLNQRGNQAYNTNAFINNMNQGVSNLNAQDAQARMNNTRLAMQTNQQVASENRRAWQWNEADPYLRTAQNVANLRRAGNQNIVSGISGIGQAMMMGGSGMFGGQQAQSGSAFNPYANPLWNQNAMLNNGLLA